MNNLPPIFRDQRKIDSDHLNLLAIFHFVGAGFAVLGILFILVHFAVFHTVMANPKIWENQKSGPPPAEFFAIFKWMYLVFGLWFLSSCVLNLISAFCLRARKARAFSMVVAGINCLHVPIGTVLGVFTIIVLVRDSVRQLYEA
jgi:peptidoglycan biosynthesis protein MviN/MurJ (putative lipid II flippase)